MTQEQLDQMKDTARRTGRAVGSHPKLKVGDKLHRQRDNFNVTVTEVKGNTITIKTTKGDHFTSTAGSDLFAEFQVVS